MPVSLYSMSSSSVLAFQFNHLSNLTLTLNLAASAALILLDQVSYTCYVFQLFRLHFGYADSALQGTFYSLIGCASTTQNQPNTLIIAYDA